MKELNNIEELNKIYNLNYDEKIFYLSSKKVIKRFNDNYNSDYVVLLDNYIIGKKMKYNSNGLILWNNEIKALYKLRTYPFFPKLVAMDKENLIIYMTYCGPSISKIRELPINWKFQFICIKNILLKENINPNDINEKNICYFNGLIKIIDFGIANNREVQLAINKLYYILNNKYTKTNLI